MATGQQSLPHRPHDGGGGVHSDDEAVPDTDPSDVSWDPQRVGQLQ